MCHVQETRENGNRGMRALGARIAATISHLQPMVASQTGKKSLATVGTSVDEYVSAFDEYLSLLDRNQYDDAHAVLRDRMLPMLEEIGISAEVIDPRTLNPLDTKTILESVAKTGRLVVVDQSTRHGSAAAVIAAEVVSEGFGSLKAPVRLVTALDATVPYSAPMEEYLLPNEAKIVEAVQQVLGNAPVAA